MEGESMDALNARRAIRAFQSKFSDFMKQFKSSSTASRSTNKLHHELQIHVALLASNIPPIEFVRIVIEVSDSLMKASFYQIALDVFLDVLLNNDCLQPLEPVIEASSLMVQALFNKSLCLFNLIKLTDPYILDKSSLSTCLKALTLIQDGMFKIVHSSEEMRRSLALLIYTGTIHIYTIASHLATAGFSKDIVEFLSWSVLSIESVLELCTIEYLPWRVKLYSSICRCFEDFKLFDSAAEAAKQALNIIDQQRSWEGVAQPIPDDIVAILDNQQAKVKILLFKFAHLEGKSTKDTLLSALSEFDFDTRLKCLVELLSDPFRRTLQHSSLQNDRTRVIIDTFMDLISGKSQVYEAAVPKKKGKLKNATEDVIVLDPKIIENAFSVHMHIAMIENAFNYEAWTQFDFLVASFRNRNEQDECYVLELDIMDTLKCLEQEDPVQLSTLSSVARIFNAVRESKCFSRPNFAREIFEDAALLIWKEHLRRMFSRIGSLSQDELLENRSSEFTLVATDLGLAIFKYLSIEGLVDTFVLSWLCLSLESVLVVNEQHQAACTIARSALRHVNSFLQRLVPRQANISCDLSDTNDISEIDCLHPLLFSMFVRSEIRIALTQKKENNFRRIEQRLLKECGTNSYQKALVYKELFNFSKDSRYIESAINELKLSHAQEIELEKAQSKQLKIISRSPNSITLLPKLENTKFSGCIIYGKPVGNGMSVSSHNVDLCGLGIIHPMDTPIVISGLVPNQNYIFACVGCCKSLKREKHSWQLSDEAKTDKFASTPFIFDDRNFELNMSPLSSATAEICSCFPLSLIVCWAELALTGSSYCISRVLDYFCMKTKQVTPFTWKYSTDWPQLQETILRRAPAPLVHLLVSVLHARFFSLKPPKSKIAAVSQRHSIVAFQPLMLALHSAMASNLLGPAVQTIEKIIHHLSPLLSLPPLPDLLPVFVCCSNALRLIPIQLWSDSIHNFAPSLAFHLIRLLLKTHSMKAANSLIQSSQLSLAIMLSDSKRLTYHYDLFDYPNENVSCSQSEKNLFTYWLIDPLLFESTKGLLTKITIPFLDVWSTLFSSLSKAFELVNSSYTTSDNFLEVAARLSRIAYDRGEVRLLNEWLDRWSPIFSAWISAFSGEHIVEVNETKENEKGKVKEKDKKSKKTTQLDAHSLDIEHDPKQKQSFLSELLFFSALSIDLQLKSTDSIGARWIALLYQNPEEIDNSLSQVDAPKTVLQCIETLNLSVNFAANSDSLVIMENSARSMLNILYAANLTPDQCSSLVDPLLNTVGKLLAFIDDSKWLSELILFVDGVLFHSKRWKDLVEINETFLKRFDFHFGLEILPLSCFAHNQICSYLLENLDEKKRELGLLQAEFNRDEHSILARKASRRSRLGKQEEDDKLETAKLRFQPLKLALEEEILKRQQVYDSADQLRNASVSLLSNFRQRNKHTHILLHSARLALVKLARQSVGNTVGVVRKYLSAIDLLEDSSEANLLVDSLNELGDLMIVNGDQTEAAKLWHKSVDLCFLQENVFGSSKLPHFDSLLAQKFPILLLSVTSTLHRLVRHIYFNDICLRRQAALLASTAVRAMFASSLPHPTELFCFAGYDVDKLSLDQNSFDPFCSDASSIANACLCFGKELIWGGFYLDALPLFTLSSFIARHILCDKTLTNDIALWKARACICSGFIAEAGRLIYRVSNNVSKNEYINSESHTSENNRKFISELISPAAVETHHLILVKALLLYTVGSSDDICLTSVSEILRPFFTKQEEVEEKKKGSKKKDNILHEANAKQSVPTVDSIEFFISASCLLANIYRALGDLSSAEKLLETALNWPIIGVDAALLLIIRKIYLKLLLDRKMFKKYSSLSSQISQSATAFHDWDIIEQLRIWDAFAIISQHDRISTFCDIFSEDKKHECVFKMVNGVYSSTSALRPTLSFNFSSGLLTFGSLLVASQHHLAPSVFSTAIDNLISDASSYSVDIKRFLSLDNEEAAEYISGLSNLYYPWALPLAYSLIQQKRLTACININHYFLSFPFALYLASFYELRADEDLKNASNIDQVAGLYVSALNILIENGNIHVHIGRIILKLCKLFLDNNNHIAAAFFLLAANRNATMYDFLLNHTHRLFSPEFDVSTSSKLSEILSLDRINSRSVLLHFVSMLRNIEENGLYPSFNLLAFLRIHRVLKLKFSPYANNCCFLNEFDWKKASSDPQFKNGGVTPGFLCLQWLPVSENVVNLYYAISEEEEEKKSKTETRVGLITGIVSLSRYELIDIGRGFSKMRISTTNGKIGDFQADFDSLVNRFRCFIVQDSDLPRANSIQITSSLLTTIEDACNINRGIATMNKILVSLLNTVLHKM